MAQATTSIGFAVTQSTSYLSPYAVARTMSPLDHITGGRVGINVVTSFGKAPAKCFGIEDAVPHDERYAAAEEYMEILYRLWEQSWEDGAQVWSPNPEMAYNPSKIHKIEFEGKYHKFSGYHQTHPSPQRTPSIFQAGQSKSGIAFAGRHAEGIYCGTPTIPKLRAYADSVRQSARDAGRDPSTVKLFCSLCPILGRTEEEAQAKYEKYRKNASVQGGLASFCALTGVDLGKYDLDQPFNFDDEELSKAGIQAIFNNSRRWRMTSLGTPEQVADVVEKWFVEGDIDGFNIAYQSNPESIEDLVELLVPELQKRGIYRDEYPVVGGTLRENMQNKPGQPLAAPDHPAAKLRWDKVKAAEDTKCANGGEQQATAKTYELVELGKTPAVSVTVDAMPVASS
ncbi:hypothetical protein LTR85_009262 [Meristemomyces frigidus]|nr:hypothetical protein LTR85_009262 [Meristemomyces frigidus]